MTVDIQNRTNSPDEYEVDKQCSERTDYAEKLIAPQERQVVPQSVYRWREILLREMETLRKTIVVLQELFVRFETQWDILLKAQPLLEYHYFALQDYSMPERISSTLGVLAILYTKAPKDNTAKMTSLKGKCWTRTEKIEKEKLVKPSVGSIQLSDGILEDVALFKVSIISCVTDIESSEVTTKAHIAIELLGSTLDDYKQNLQNITFHIKSSVYGSSLRRNETKSVYYSLRKKSGKLKALFDLESHENLIKIENEKITVKFEVCVIKQPVDVKKCF